MYKPIPTRYHKIHTVTGTDQYQRYVNKIRLYYVTKYLSKKWCCQTTDTETLRHTHTHTHTYIYIYIYIYICVCVRVCVCLSVCLCVHARTRECVCVTIRVCLCRCVSVCLTYCKKIYRHEEQILGLLLRKNPHSTQSQAKSPTDWEGTYDYGYI